MYWRDANDVDKALGAYGRALEIGSEADRKRLWPEIPPALRGRLDPSLAPAGYQTSASKG
jgi:hypothetical protein